MGDPLAIHNIDLFARVPVAPTSMFIDLFFGSALETMTNKGAPMGNMRSSTPLKTIDRPEL